jgi:hypothetical protein
MALAAAWPEGALLPDGRLYVSAVYSDQDVEQTISAF